MPTPWDKDYYLLSVPPGTWVVFAWTREDGTGAPPIRLGGSYSPAVACGLRIECTDHTPIPVEVHRGSTLTGIDICDWYGRDGDVPLP